MIEIVKNLSGNPEYVSKYKHISEVASVDVKSPNLAGLFNPFLRKDVKALFEGGYEENPITEAELKDIKHRGDVVLWNGYWMPLVEVKFIASLIEENYTPAMRIVWGYINGRTHYLGDLAEKGQQSSSMCPGYQIWVQLYKI